VATDAQDVFFESRYTQLLQNEELRLALWARLLLATAAFALALTIRFVLLPAEYGSAYFTFYPAVLAAAVFLGAGPALVVVALSAIAGDWFFLPPSRSGAVDLRLLAPVIAFTLSGAAICWLAHVARRSVGSLQAERKDLQAEKQKLLRLQDALPVGVVLNDMSGRFIEFNAAFARLTGYTVEELRQLDDQALAPPLCAGEPGCQRALALHGRCGPVEKDFARKDGSTIRVQVTGTLFEPVPGRRCILSVVEDVTERRRVQDGFEQILREQKAILDSRVVGIARIENHKIAWANEQYAAMFGYSLNEILGAPTRLLYPSDEAHSEFVAAKNAVIQRGEIYKTELPLARKGGEIGWFEATCGPLVGGTGEQIATIVDATERHRLAVELQQARTELQAIIDHIPARITSWNLDGTNCFANRTAEEQFGIAPGSATGKHVREIIGAGAYDPTKHYIDATFAGFPQKYDRADPQPDGSVRYTHLTAVPKMRDGQVVGAYVLAIDMTDLHNAQQTLAANVAELRESHARVSELAERLATVREDERRAVAVRLHEGVAQELYAAQLSLQELEREGRGHAGISELARQLARVIDQSIEDVRNLTDDLYPTSLAHLSLLEALGQLAGKFGRRAGVKVDVQQMPEFPQLDAPSQVLFFRAAQEALANVARHASATTVNISLEADSERVAMLVADDGKGIAPTDLHKAGSLGLLGIRERFTAAGGGVAVDRRPPAGTCVTVFLPAAS
jgi:PAS domain S-box-containing protein